MNCLSHWISGSGWYDIQTELTYILLRTILSFLRQVVQSRIFGGDFRFEQAAIVMLILVSDGMRACVNREDLDPIREHGEGSRVAG